MKKKNRNILIISSIILIIIILFLTLFRQSALPSWMYTGSYTAVGDYNRNTNTVTLPLLTGTGTGEPIDYIGFKGLVTSSGDTWNIAGIPSSKISESECKSFGGGWVYDANHEVYVCDYVSMFDNSNNYIKITGGWRDSSGGSRCNFIGWKEVTLYKETQIGGWVETIRLGSPYYLECGSNPWPSSIGLPTWGEINIKIEISQTPITPACEEGTLKCDSNSVYTCTNNAWVLREVCGENKYCEDNECKIVQTQCTSSQLEITKPCDKATWVDYPTCAWNIDNCKINPIIDVINYLPYIIIGILVFLILIIIYIRFIRK